MHSFAFTQDRARENEFAPSPAVKEMAVVLAHGDGLTSGSVGGIAREAAEKRVGEAGGAGGGAAGNPSLPWLGQIIPSLERMLAEGEAGRGTSEETGGESRRGASAKGARQVVLILADGLGYRALTESWAYVPTLRAFREETRQALTCVPSTTAAALTSLATGKNPGATQMVGYSVYYRQNLMNLLAFRPDVDARKWQPCQTRFEEMGEQGVSSTVVTRGQFAGSGLTQAAFRGAKFLGQETLIDRFAGALHELRAGTQFVYVYWSEIDHAGHAYGCHSPEWFAEVEDFDRALGQFLREMPAGVPVFLTADHGMTNVGVRLDLAETPALAEGVAAIAGEGRCIHLHCPPESTPADQEKVLERWQDILGDIARVVPARETANYLGAGAGNRLIGAGMVFLTDAETVIVDSRTQSPRSIALTGVHGSITPAEMLIPLIRLA